MPRADAAVNFTIFTWHFLTQALLQRQRCREWTIELTRHVGTRLFSVEV